MNSPKRVPLTFILDETGLLHFLELDFSIERIYFLSNIRPGATRGNHAHKELHQIFLAMRGSYHLTLTDGINHFEFLCDSPDFGVYVPPGHWRELSNFSHDALCLVLASKHFDESDYIRDKVNFLEWSKNAK